MQTPKSLLNKLTQNKVTNYINQQFDNVTEIIQDIDNILIAVPENWTLEELKIADVFLKEWGWNSSIEKKYNITPDPKEQEKRYIKIFPVKTISEEEIEIIRAKEIFLKSQNVDLTKIDILVKKDESNPYTETSEGENNG